MNWRDIQYHLRRITDPWVGRFGGDTRRLKLIGVSVLLGIMLIWLVFTLAPALMPKRRAKDPSTAGWKLVRQLNEDLVARPEFADANFDVVTESPLKLRLAGAVRTKRDLESLREYLKGLSDVPQDQLDFEVEVLDESAK